MKKKKNALNMTEAANLIGVDRRTILRWVEKGYLQAITYPSGNHRILETEIKSFLKKQKERR